MSNIIDTPLHWETDFMRVQYNKEGNYVDEIWKGYANDDEVVECQNKVLEILKNSKSTAYIADMYKFQGASPEVQEWVVKEWFPKMFEAGLKTLSMVFPPDQFGTFSMEQVLTEEVSNKLNKEMFKTYDEASNWIKQYTK